MENCGLRYLQTDEFELKGEKRRNEYMVYQDATKMIVWKRTSPRELFKFHTEANIVRRADIDYKT